ncbi:MAG: TlpA disulfide reductase family protein [Bacteroidia bacterium]|nr:TlpA disulfide reductase family protein [Bacteroidia bacterium]
MKHLTTILLITALLASCKPEAKVACLISGTVKNATDKEIKLTVGTKADTLKLNADGTFSKEISVTRPSDAVLQGTKLYATLFLLPGKNLAISVDALDFNKDLTFSGSLAAENDFIVKKSEGEEKTYPRLNEVFKSPYTPADYKRIRDSIRLADLEFLGKYTNEKGKLDPAFVERQKTVIQFGYYGDLNNYPRMAGYYNTDKPVIPADWYSFMDGVNLDNPALLGISEAKYFISSWVSAQVMKVSGMSQEVFYKNSAEVGKLTFKYLQENFKSPEFFNLMAFESLKGVIDSEGPKGFEGLISEYLAKSTDEANKKALKEMTDGWASMAPGQPAPVFNLPDIDGKMVSLTDFAGKYVFIDYWATWCGPCKAEVPSYKKLIEDYKGKSIVFISISVDKDKAAWEKMVKEGIPEVDPETGKPAVPAKMIRMTWLQLHDAVRYNKIWLVKFIPTFVLIDPKGMIVNARAERPSNPELRKVIDALTGI